MKELILRATLETVGRSTTLPWICTQLSQLVREPEEASAAPPRLLLSWPQEGELWVWLKDTAGSSDSPFCRYSRLSFRPLEISPSALPGKSAEVKIAVGLLPAAWLYVAAPLDSLLQQGLEPRQVTADGRVVTMDELTPAQMRCMQHIYAVADDGLAARLHGGSLHRPAPAGVRPNRYAELEREVHRLLEECFCPGGEAEGCPLRLHLQLCDVHPSRLHSIAPEHRLLLFGDNRTAYDPRHAFRDYGACVAIARRKLRLVMLYPAGGVEAARKLCLLLQSLTGVTSFFPVSNEEEWIEYKVKDDVVDRVKQSLLHLKQRNYNRPDLMVCYISPSGDDAVTAQRLHLRTHVGLCCHHMELLCMDSIPQQAVEGEKLGKYADSLASRLVVKLKGLSWMPQLLITQDTDLILCLSHSVRRHHLICGATFCTDQRASKLHHFVCEERHFPAYLYSDFKQAYSHFVAEHGGQPPQRLVVYCHRHVDERPLAEFARLLARAVPRLRVVAAFLRLTGSDYPAFYDPSSPCCMPPDGTYISCPDDAYLLFCSDFRPGDALLPTRYPHPLEVRLRHLEADGSYSSVASPEAEVLMTQAYQLTCLNPERVERCVVPVIALHTDRMVRRAHREQDARDAAAAAAAASIGGGGVARWRSVNVLM